MSHSQTQLQTLEHMCSDTQRPLLAMAWGSAHEGPQSDDRSDEPRIPSAAGSIADPGRPSADWPNAPFMGAFDGAQEVSCVP